MGMKNQDIFDLMGRFESSGIARMKVTVGDTTLELEKYAAATPQALSRAAAVSGDAAAAVTAAPAASAPEPTSVAVSDAAPASEGLCITAPLVGTFYAAPAPDKDPYVKVGDCVKKGETVCLLEAMKMMSEVPAPCDCVIEEVLVADGELVSFGDAIIRYREA